MKDQISAEIKKYVVESKENWLEEIHDAYYEEPLIGFASADDPLFEEFKNIIGNEHFTPREVYERAFGKDSYYGGTVISVVLPINEKIRNSNSVQTQWASKEWALLRYFGDSLFIKEFRRQLCEFFSGLGTNAVAPLDVEGYKTYRTDSGPSSNWSERHIAYAAGLGTFGLNDGFISDKGIAIRLASFVIDQELSPDERKTTDHTANCLFYSRGICAGCIKRCPVGAISKDGHDKKKCYAYVYGEQSQQLAVSYGGDAACASGCGLCQTNVPCESRNPNKLV